MGTQLPLKGVQQPSALFGPCLHCAKWSPISATADEHWFVNVCRVV